MQIVVLCNDEQKAELTSGGVQDSAEVVWITDVHAFFNYPTADVFMDLLFETLDDRLQLLEQLLPKTVVINSVVDTLQQTHSSFIRINGWPTFLQASLLEASATDGTPTKELEKVFAHFGKTVEWLPDAPGFVTPRVISTIINEAFFALQEGVSTPQEIDTALKLGTAYPYGPFEWSKKIGLQNICTLLQQLSKTQKRYTPCDLLVQETDKAI
jgi:3-hydroxybutyryl-CoA dehydrogenase